MTEESKDEGHSEDKGSYSEFRTPVESRMVSCKTDIEKCAKKMLSQNKAFKKVQLSLDQTMQPISGCKMPFDAHRGIIMSKDSEISSLILTPTSQPKRSRNV